MGSALWDAQRAIKPITFLTKAKFGAWTLRGWQDMATASMDGTAQL
jgi:hypothetical protein